MTSKGLRISNKTSVFPTRITRRSAGLVINDENKIGTKNIGKGPPINPLKNTTKGLNSKRKSDVSLNNKPTKKRSAFGDITNAIEKTFKENKKVTVEKEKVSVDKVKTRNSSNASSFKNSFKKKNTLKITKEKQDQENVKKQPIKVPKKESVLEESSSFCDSLQISQGLSKNILSDSSTYITASEGR